MLKKVIQSEEIAKTIYLNLIIIVNYNFIKMNKYAAVTLVIACLVGVSTQFELKKAMISTVEKKAFY